MAKQARPGSKERTPAEAGTAEMRLRAGLSPERDPGDSVAYGVAPVEPVPLTEDDKEVLEKLKRLPERGGPVS